MKTPEALYIHIPFCISKCSYCDFFSIGCGKSEIPQSYVDALCCELLFRFKQSNITKLKTVYIGGGTPSLLNPKQLRQICETISKVTLDENYEFTIEVNPDDLSKELLEVYNNCGINRISCGIQTLNENALSFSNRRASYSQNIKALDLLSEYWNKSLSLDVICGLPEETEQSFLEGLTKIIEYKPHHISMYSLTIEEETPFGKAVDSGKIKLDYEFQDDLWLAGRKLLVENNYSHYEVSNFSKPGKECKHNLVYWKHEGYIGAGSGACGSVYREDGTGLRWTNKPDIQGYINNWKACAELKNDFEEVEEIDKDTSEFEFFMMGFRKLTGITDAEYESVFKCKLPDSAVEVFNKWKLKGLLDITTENNVKRYNLNKEGILLLNPFLEELI